MASARTGAALEIRKIRKKLRQIENLESIDRDLTDEELNKILKKNTLRDNLLKLLAEHGEEESFTSSTRSEITDDDILTYTPSNQTFDDYNTSNYDNNDVGGEITVIEPEDETNTDMIDIDVSGDDLENVEVTNKTTNASGEVVEEVTAAQEKSKTVSQATGKTQQSGNPSPDKKSKKITASNTRTEKPETQKSSKVKSTLHKWRFGHFEMIELEGHSDLVTDADMDEGLLVTSSRDTTVKLWNMDTLTEIRNYGGHSSAVTCVQLLSKVDSSSICQSLELESVERIFISGSYDCSFKVWSATKSGQAMKSVYTFNPVTKVIYHPVAHVIITGSDGGKLDMWDISSGESLHSSHPYEEAVTGLKIDNGLIYSSSADGIISVHTVKDKELSCLFMSENIRSENNGHLTQRYIRGFDVRNNLIFYGDDGTNIKILDWKKGLVHKIVNHCEEFGVTDSICCHGNLMVSSAYSIDSGFGYVNVRYLPDETYITTLNDEETGRILSLSYTESGNKNMLVTAGMQLKVWIMHTDSSNSEDEDMIRTQYLPKLAQRHCQDSDVESEAETTDSEEEEGIRDNNRPRSLSHESSQGNGWLSWCNII